MRERVRAILVTGDGHLLTIQRIKPGQAPYWVLPGGGVEDDDPSREDALLREVREELGGEAHIHSLIHVDESTGERQLFYLATITSWDLSHRTGPEFADPTRGEYHVQEVPLSAAGIASIDLKPEQVADLLARNESGVFELPDLRSATSAAAGRSAPARRP